MAEYPAEYLVLLPGSRLMATSVRTCMLRLLGLRGSSFAPIVIAYAVAGLPLLCLSHCRSPVDLLLWRLSRPVVTAPVGRLLGLLYFCFRCRRRFSTAASPLLAY